MWRFGGGGVQVDILAMVHRLQGHRLLGSRWADLWRPRSGGDIATGPVQLPARLSGSRSLAVLGVAVGMMALWSHSGTTPHQDARCGAPERCTFYSDEHYALVRETVSLSPDVFCQKTDVARPGGPDTFAGTIRLRLLVGMTALWSHSGTTAHHESRCGEPGQYTTCSDEQAMPVRETVSLSHDVFVRRLTEGKLFLWTASTFGAEKHNHNVEHKLSESRGEITMIEKEMDGSDGVLCNTREKKMQSLRGDILRDRDQLQEKVQCCSEENPVVLERRALEWRKKVNATAKQNRSNGVSTENSRVAVIEGPESEKGGELVRQLNCTNGTRSAELSVDVNYRSRRCRRCESVDLLHRSNLFNETAELLYGRFETAELLYRVRDSRAALSKGRESRAALS
ncbi:hypothetical protein DFP72DRAFT_1143454 [Ephemerocybe angulata]|uniref:Uncharacterized protein n=1 Tax=Ephemerocybe angulata TaxID=980116 RepID=A0A8H6M0T2_9AGAR|nr:hypothetical protein DFP72DRAFT_1143454 [Tulosesus angulatus]